MQQLFSKICMADFVCQLMLGYKMSKRTLEIGKCFAEDGTSAVPELSDFVLVY